MQTALGKIFITVFTCFISVTSIGQGNVNWSADGNAYFRGEGGEIVKYTLPNNKKSILVKKENLKPAGTDKPLTVQ